ncbi:MAG: invasion associated locus B family protein [Pseudomonadota bacterium]
MFKKAILSLLFLLSLSGNLSAQELQGKFADWSVFTADFNKKKICYMVSLPIKKDGNYYRRGEPYFLITNSSDNIDEITIASGYVYKEASEVELSFGLKKFNIFTYKSLAWANSKTDDIDIIKEMRRNLDIVVLGVNKKNQYSSDIYSLIGFNQAYGKMKEVCDSLQIAD